MNICINCLRENGKHTEYCEELKSKSAGAKFTIQYYLLRATLSAYKASCEPNKYLVPMWEKSSSFWCEAATNSIAKGQTIQMADA